MLTLSCSKKEDAPKPNPTPAPAPAPAVNLKATTAKPSAKPNVANNIKNEASKSTRATGTPTTTDKNKTGGTVTILAAAPAAGTNTNALLRGNKNTQRTAEDGMLGWSVSEVYVLDPTSENDTIFIVSNSANHIDSDEDGIEDILDNDDDNDGDLDDVDTDDDGDGVSDANDDDDDDNDGILDINDLDDDGDGVLDCDETLASALDSDNDGTLDSVDTDDDGDGILDADDSDDDGDGINDDDEDDLADMDKDFDFSLFFFPNGEYFTYDASETNDAWDWGNWYADATGKYIALDLGTADEELYEIESVNGSTMIVSTYDEESGLTVYIKLENLNL